MNAEYKTENKFARHLTLGCECGCGNGISIELERDGAGGWWSSTAARFSTSQGGLMDRVRMAWHILRHGDYIFHEVVLTDDDLKAMRDFIDDNFRTRNENKEEQ